MVNIIGYTCPSIGSSGDRGCVDCGLIVSPEQNMYIVPDDRDRYWCLKCAMSALSKIRRRVDERNNINNYRWNFGD